MIDGTQAKKRSLLDGDYNLSRHITVISSNQFRMSISNSIKLFAGTRQPDNVIQTDTAPAPVDEYVVPPPAPTYAATASFSAPAAPVPSDTLAAPAQVSKYVAPAPDVTYAAPARVDCVAPALVVEYIAPARVAPSLQPPRVNFDIPGLMNPQLSTTFVEASTPMVAPVSLAYQEQIVAEEVVERIQEQIGSERIEEQIGDILVPPIVVDTVEVVQITPRSIFSSALWIRNRSLQERRHGTSCDFILCRNKRKYWNFQRYIFTERIQEQIVPRRTEEQIRDIPVLLFVEETVEVE